ncbi:PA0061/PA0062 family lipoprotein, partial [Pseudomonas aeruginosa]|uniref:PA0061/PA0062 family lipoprotein n=1 Tax=Pseudomonas aeruginosa TaxID=287 RepID=UPI00211AABE4
MRPLTRLVPLALLLLAGCAGPLPQPDPQMAWVELRSAPANTLLAERLDGERLSDGRYFQVTPGRHVLEVRFQYELYGGFGGGGGGSGGRGRTTANRRGGFAGSGGGRGYPLGGG